MRYGFTTGSCAAAAAKAAAYMLLSGYEKHNISITTPKGIIFNAEIENISKGKDWVSCAVRKDGGDDIDVTTGALIFAKVIITSQSGCEIKIDGTKGVGRVTKPGLDQPVGNAAINKVPRKMIENEVRDVFNVFDFKGSVLVEISIPDGEKLAEKTFNPRLGIVGGISVLGTSGIVEPMSVKAIIDTIGAELSMKRALGFESICIAPGNYGLDFMNKKYGYNLDLSVKCSNFIGETLDIVVEKGFKNLLILGHIGKLIKLSGGIMNTHSKEADCRMELLASACIKSNVDYDIIKKILDCVTTDEALVYINKTGKLYDVMNYVIERIMFYIEKRTQKKINVECIIYSNELGELGKTSGAYELLEKIKKAGA